MRLDNFLENNNLLSPNQIGFRKGFRTTDNIFILKTVINKYLNRRNGKVFVCFVDFKKAFGDKHVYSNFWIRELEGTFTILLNICIQILNIHIKVLIFIVTHLWLILE